MNAWHDWLILSLKVAGNEWLRSECVKCNEKCVDSLSFGLGCVLLPTAHFSVSYTER